MASEHKENNPHTTFRFNRGLKEDFKKACEDSGESMTTVLEMLMLTFIISSKKTNDVEKKG